MYRAQKAPLQKMEETLKAYYHNSAELKRLKLRQEMLRRHKTETEADLSLFPPESDSGVKKQLAGIARELAECNQKVRSLERYAADMDYILGTLDQEAREFVSLRYGQDLSYRRIGDRLHMSEASVYRLRSDILMELHEKVG